MLTGKNALLRDVLEFFMDYGIKIDPSKHKDAKNEEIKAKKVLFSTGAQSLIKQLRERIQEGHEHIMKYALNTGASFGSATPDFDGQLSEAELYSALRLIISYQTGIEIPATFLLYTSRCV